MSENISLKRKWTEDENNSDNGDENNVDQIKNKEEEEKPSARAMSAALLRGKTVNLVRPGAPIMIDAATGLAARAESHETGFHRSARFGLNSLRFFCELSCVLDEAAGALALSDEAVARLAVAILFYNVYYNYFDGVWCVYLPSELECRSSEMHDDDGRYISQVLLPKVVAPELLKAANDEPPERRVLLYSAAVRLQAQQNELPCLRIVQRMEWLRLWHSPPLPPITPVEQDPKHALVGEWLMHVHGCRLVRRAADLPPLCEPKSYKTAPPAFLWRMQSDFVEFWVARGAANCSIASQHFSLLVADWLGEWPHVHEQWNGGDKAHLIGYQWYADEHRWQPDQVRTLYRMSGELASIFADERQRERLQQHFVDK